MNIWLNELNNFIIILMNELLDNTFKIVEKEKEESEEKKEPVKTETEIKLEKLNNINKKLDFFKMDYIDRYISYKEKNPNLSDEQIIVDVNIGLDNSFYTNTIDSPNKYTNIVLCNKFYYLGSDYEPKNLTLINSKYTSDKRYMEKDAAEAFEKMASDANKEGYTIRAISTYRSYDYQTQLYNRYAQKDGKEKADTYSARAGYSEHQTGLAVDVDNKQLTYTNFGKAKEFNWMKENAYKYGFILRYTKEYEPITGYKDEPWHYRYVGIEIATYIQNHPMTYEEYYVRFLDK
jgi:D-alanyl-D-alanine carboxypeptidase